MRAIFCITLAILLGDAQAQVSFCFLGWGCVKNVGRVNPEFEQCQAIYSAIVAMKGFSPRNTSVACLSNTTNVSGFDIEFDGPGQLLYNIAFIVPPYPVMPNTISIEAMSSFGDSNATITNFLLSLNTLLTPSFLSLGCLLNGTAFSEPLQCLGE
jgi:hypothetical protein